MQLLQFALVHQLYYYATVALTAGISKMYPALNITTMPSYTCQGFLQANNYISSYNRLINIVIILKSQLITLLK